MRYGLLPEAIHKKDHARALPLHLVKATAGRLVAKRLRTPYSQKLIISSEETQFESGKPSTSQLKRRSDGIITRQETRNGAVTHRKPADDDDSSLMSRKPEWRGTASEALTIFVCRLIFTDFLGVERRECASRMRRLSPIVGRSVSPAVPFGFERSGGAWSASGRS
jgi:hypothetical protein